MRWLDQYHHQISCILFLYGHYGMYVVLVFRFQLHRSTHFFVAIVIWKEWKQKNDCALWSFWFVYAKICLQFQSLNKWMRNFSNAHWQMILLCSSISICSVSPLPFIVRSTNVKTSGNCQALVQIEYVWARNLHLQSRTSQNKEMQ